MDKTELELPQATFFIWDRTSSLDSGPQNPNEKHSKPRASKTLSFVSLRTAATQQAEAGPLLGGAGGD